MATQHNSPNLHWRDLISSSDTASSEPPRNSGNVRWDFRFFRKALPGQRYREIRLLGRPHPNVHEGLFSGPQLAKSSLRETPYFQQQVGFAATQNVNMCGDRPNGPALYEDGLR